MTRPRFYEKLFKKGKGKTKNHVSTSQEEVRLPGLNVDGVFFPFEKETTIWQLRMPSSALSHMEDADVSLLTLDHPAFLSMEVFEDSQGLSFRYELPQKSLDFSELEAQSPADKLRFGLNLLGLSSILDLPLTTTLDPDNLYIAPDLQVRIAYRALPAHMVPFSFTESDFLREWKAVMVSLFTDYAFKELVIGALETVDLPTFLEGLLACQSLEEAKTFTQEAYEEEREKEDATFIQVSAKRHQFYKLGSIWLGALAGILFLPLVYLVFIQAPYKERLLKADTAYLKLDYTGVITTLSPISVNRLPVTQKVELATAYIKGLPFSDDQRQVIMNNVSFQSDELYLTYWIEIGRKQLDQAIDTGKRLNDSDLIIYALVQKMKAVREDDKLSGQEREQTLSSLQAEYKKYWDERVTNLAEENPNASSDKKEGEGTAGTSQTSNSTSPSSTSSTAPEATPAPSAPTSSEQSPASSSSSN